MLHGVFAYLNPSLVRVTGGGPGGLFGFSRGLRYRPCIGANAPVFSEPQIDIEMNFFLRYIELANGCGLGTKIAGA